MNGERQEPASFVPLASTNVQLGRRRLLRGSLGAAPVLMTLASGPVSAGLCTTGSAFGSMRPSGTQATITCGGRTPATWYATAYGHWPIAANALFQTYFTPSLAGTNVTLKDVLDPTKGYNLVARNCVAALLNASMSPPLTPATVLGAAYAKAIWSAYATQGYFEPTAGVQWTSAKIVEWIGTTYA
jgi:hypothetical protein